MTTRSPLTPGATLMSWSRPSNLWLFPLASALNPMIEGVRRVAGFRPRCPLDPDYDPSYVEDIMDGSTAVEMRSGTP